MVESSGQAGAGVIQNQEDLTPEMISAGEDAICDWGDILDPHALAEKVYNAMERERHSHDRSHQGEQKL